MKQTIVYKAFGLHFRSEIPLPELPEAAESEESAEVDIVLGELASRWQSFEAPKHHFVVADNSLYFCVEEVAIFCVQEGKRITVSPAACCDERKLRLYILGSCMGALLLQRGILPLHGSAVVVHGKAYAIIGESGAGKSTLAAAFLHRGYRLLTDDVIPVTMNAAADAPLVTPSYPQQKLWEESIEKLGMAENVYQPLYQELSKTKYAIPVSDRFVSETVPLGGIIELVKTEEQAIELRRLRGLERLPIMHIHTYRNFLVPLLGLNQWHFSQATRIFERIDMFRLKRPSSGFSAHELVSDLLTEITEGAQAACQ